MSKYLEMEELIKAVNTTPIIDNHAHPLLIPSAQDKYDFLAITTEAQGDAIRTTESSLAHIRAVKQLSGILGCLETWDDVVKAIEVERSKSHHVWAKRCLDGIETILIDDGLDGADDVYEYAWHDKLTRSQCKRIVRIEKPCGGDYQRAFKQHDLSPEEIFAGLREGFEQGIQVSH